MTSTTQSINENDPRPGRKVPSDSTLKEENSLATCSDIHNEDLDATTPFEECFTSLVMMWGVGVSLTPNAIERQMVMFRRDFNDMISAAEKMLQRHPALFKAGVHSAIV
jgi:hypothetical protein